MSYLTTPDLPEFSKCIISFWFQVSQKDLDAAQKEEDDWNDAHRGDESEDPDPPPPLLGKVPLLVFGKKGTSAKHPKEHNDVQSEPQVHSLTSCATHDPTYESPFPIACVAWQGDCSDSSYETTCSHTTVSYSTTGGKPTEPSYVAVNGSGSLCVRFESAEVGAYSGNCGLLSGSSDCWPGGHSDLCCHYPIAGGCGGGGECLFAPFIPGNIWPILIWVLNVIVLRMLTAVADVCEVSGGGGDKIEGEYHVGAIPGDQGSGAISWDGGSADGDKWHHVLISVDMSKGSSATGGSMGATSTLYVAIDDTNIKTGRYPLQDTNEVATAGASAAYGTQGGGDCPAGSYSQASLTVPSAPLGIPATGEYVDKIRQTEMAELLFFTDHVLDTSDVGNRRHFISGPDKNGYQTPTNTWPLFIPMRKFAIGDPFYWEDGADNPAFAPPLFDPSAWPTGIKGIGIAEIDFTKCSWNWQMGRNIGKLRGKVEKTGQIKEYDPKDPPRIKAG